MAQLTDWGAWHADYDDPASPLSRRLRIICDHITAWLDRTAPHQVSVLSLCAGDGRDLIDVLARRFDADRVTALLVEIDPRLADAAAARATTARLSGLTVRRADAGRMSTCADAAPADLVLLCGVFGNVSDVDVRRTIEALPQLTAEGGTVVWTRHRREPDLTPSIRGWFSEAGFAEGGFAAPDDAVFSVGLHRFHGVPAPREPATRLFTFLR